MDYFRNIRYSIMLEHKAEGKGILSQRKERCGKQPRTAKDEYRTKVAARSRRDSLCQEA